MGWTRRSLVLASAGLAACDTSAENVESQTEFGAGIAGRGALMPVRGRNLYVEIAGPRRAPPLLYLHGGPGASCYDFSVVIAARLARRLRVIMIDQRGVLRSQALAEGDTCSLNDLVEDVEALRESLGIRRWAILGHSFGGFLGLSYVLAYPQSVERVLFENPTFDFDSSGRELLRGAAEEYRAIGDTANAEASAAAAAAPTEPRETWRQFSRLTRGLGAQRDNLYFHGPDKTLFNRLVPASNLPSEMWSRGNEHQRLLQADGQIFNSLKPRLPELSHQTLLVRGAYDRVIAPDQLEAFAADPRRKIEVFSQSSHFPRFEEPDRYTEVVTNFVLG